MSLQEQWIVPSSEENTPPLPIHLLIEHLWRNWRVIAAFAVVAFVLSLAYVILTPATYKATAALLVDPRKANVTDANDVLPSFGADTAAVASQVEVLGSRNLLNAVIQQNNILTDPEFSDPSLLSRLTGGVAPTPNMIYDAFRDQLQVTRQGQTYVIYVSFLSKDPEKAARIANSVVNSYLGGQRSEKLEANDQVSGQLQERTAALRDTVAAAEAEVADYMAEHGIVETGSGDSLLMQKIELLNARVLDAKSDARAAESALDRAERNALLDPERAINAVGSAASEQLLNELSSLEAERASLSQTVGERHPQMMSLNSEIAQVRQQMNAAVERDVDRKRAEVEQARSNAVNMESDLEALRSQVHESNQQEVKLRDLQRRAAAAREVLQDFELRAEEVGQLDDMQRPDARVISSADVPPQADWPKAKLIVPVMTALGMFAGFGFVLLRAGLGPLRPRPEEDEEAFEANDMTHPATAAPAADAKNTPRHTFDTLLSSPLKFATEHEATPANAVSEHFLVPMELGALDPSVFDDPMGGAHPQVIRLLHRIVNEIKRNAFTNVVACTSSSHPVELGSLTQSLAQALHDAGNSVAIVDLSGNRSLQVSAFDGRCIFVNGTELSQIIARRKAGKRDEDPILIVEGDDRPIDGSWNAKAEDLTHVLDQLTGTVDFVFVFVPDRFSLPQHAWNAIGFELILADEAAYWDTADAMAPAAPMIAGVVRIAEHRGAFDPSPEGRSASADRASAEAQIRSRIWQDAWA